MNSATINPTQDDADPDTDSEGGTTDAAPAPARRPQAPIDAQFALHAANYGGGAVTSPFDVPQPATMPPMACNPAAITSAPGFDPDLDTTATSPAAEALKALQDAAAAVIEARQELAHNPTLSDGQRVLAVADVHDRVSKRALPLVDRATKNLDAQITALDTSLNAPLQSTSSGPLAQEIRAHVRGLPMGERISLLTQAIKAGDQLTASAVLACPVAYLTGMSSDMQRELTAQWHRARRPEDVRKLGVLTLARDRLQQGAGQFLKQTESLIGARSQTVLRMRGAQQRAQRVIGAVAPAKG